jgi:hypothetical protein
MSRTASRAVYFPVAILIAFGLLSIYIACAILSGMVGLVAWGVDSIGRTTERVINQLELWGDRL